MRIASLSLLFLLLPHLISAQNLRTDHELRRLYEGRNAERRQLWKQKRFAEAVAILEDLRRRPGLDRLPEVFLDVTYNLACGYARLGRKQEALATLREAASLSVLNYANVAEDTDFESLRGDSDFEEVLKTIQSRWKANQHLWGGAAFRTGFRENLGDDEKMAGLSNLWAEAKFNFAFFDKVPDLDWDALYLATLPQVRASKNTLEYYQTLRRFVAHLRDGHTSVLPPRELFDRLFAQPPLNTRPLDGHVIVSEVRDPALAREGIAKGVEIVAVDGIPVEEYAEKFVAPYLESSSRRELELRMYGISLLNGAAGTTVRLKLRTPGGDTIEKTVRRLGASEAAQLPPAAKPWKRFELRMLDGDIAYVALNGFGNPAIVDDFDRAFSQIQKSRGLILDVRENGGGNSSCGTRILGYLTGTPVDTEIVRTRVYRPAFRSWGLGEQWDTQTWNVPPHGTKLFKGPAILLIGPHTGSAAEDFAVGFDRMHRGPIVGEPTWGGTGNPLTIPLPGGGGARICTLQTRYADGREFVGRGVQPHIPVRFGRDDLRNGRDPALEAALARLR